MNVLDLSTDQLRQISQKICEKHVKEFDASGIDTLQRTDLLHLLHLFGLKDPEARKSYYLTLQSTWKGIMKTWSELFFQAKKFVVNVREKSEGIAIKKEISDIEESLEMM